MYNNDDFTVDDFLDETCSIQLISVGDKEEDERMSFIYTQTVKDGIIMLSDSRCTYSANGKYEFDDNYKKIHYSLKHKVLIAQAGDNLFSQEDFSNLISELENNSDTRDDFLQALKFRFGCIVENKYMKPVIKNSLTKNIFFAYYDDCLGFTPLPRIQVIDITVRTLDDTTKALTFEQRNQISKGIWSSGTNWITEFLKKTPDNCDCTSLQRINDISNLLEKAISFDNDNAATSFVGGKIQKVILRPNGNIEVL